MKCCVRGCPQRLFTSTTGFFRFPRDKSLQRQWILFSGIKDVTNLNKYRVCADHFRDDEILGRIQCELGIPRVLTLRAGVIPSIRPVDLLEKHSPRGQRMAIKERRQLVESLLKSNSERLSEEEIDQKDVENGVAYEKSDPLNDSDGQDQDQEKLILPAGCNETVDRTNKKSPSQSDYREITAAGRSKDDNHSPESGILQNRSTSEVIIAAAQLAVDLNAPKSKMLYQRDLLQNQMKLLKKLLREKRADFQKLVKRHQQDVGVLKSALKKSEENYKMIQKHLS